MNYAQGNEARQCHSSYRTYLFAIPLKGMFPRRRRRRSVTFVVRSESRKRLPVEHWSDAKLSVVRTRDSAGQ